MARQARRSRAAAGRAGGDLRPRRLRRVPRGCARKLSELEADAARSALAAQRAEAMASLEQLRRGDIIMVPGGRRAGMADPGLASDPRGATVGRPRRWQRPAAAGADRRPPGQAAFCGRLPGPGQPDRPDPDPEQVQRPVAAAPPGPGRQRAHQAGRPGHGAAGAARPEAEPAAAGGDRRAAPAGCASIPVTTAPTGTRTPGRRSSGPGWSARWQRLEASVAARSHVIARTFQRVCAVLARLGIPDGGQVTADGRRLA